MGGRLKPTYTVRAWQEDGVWLIRVTGATAGGSRQPINGITQTRSLAHARNVATDLIATILDEPQPESAFRVDLTYDLPGDLGPLVDEIATFRNLLRLLQKDWKVLLTAAVHDLSDCGLSLREVATLLDLSRQRVDQLLAGRPSEVRLDDVRQARSRLRSIT